MSVAGGRVVALAILTALAAPAWAVAGARPTPAASSTATTADQQARDLFRSGHFAEALAIYQRLRAETHHPTYLRNIGRCYQMLRQPVPAIDAFQGYLAEARDLDAAERAEIDGYIAEMRRLELTMPAASSPAAPSATGMTAPAPAGPEGHRSVLRRWWFWTGLGVLAATAVIVLVATSGEDRLPCPAGAVCP